jgi:hypothetical protein
MSRILRWVIIISAICVQTGCGRAAVTVYPDRPDGGYIDFAELEAFSYFDGHIELDWELEPFTRGRDASIGIIGKPDTEYHLSVIYSSGQSQAAGLGFKTSDREGYLSWTWRVAAQTRPGEYDAVIIGGGDEMVLKITLAE